MDKDEIKNGINNLKERELANQRREKITRWKQAVAFIAQNSHEVNLDFQTHSKIKSEEN